MTLIKNPKFVIGFTARDAVLLDFDKTGFDRVRWEASRLSQRFNLGCFLIVKSARASYHVVFDKRVPYSKACRVMDASTCYSQQNLALRARRGDSTLRISPKNRRGWVEPIGVCNPGGFLFPEIFAPTTSGVIDEYLDFTHRVRNLFTVGRPNGVSSWMDSTAPAVPSGKPKVTPARNTLTSMNSRDSRTRSATARTHGRKVKLSATPANGASPSKKPVEISLSSFHPLNALAPVERFGLFLFSLTTGAKPLRYPLAVSSSTAPKIKPLTTRSSSMRRSGSDTSKKTAPSIKSQNGLASEAPRRLSSSSANPTVSEKTTFLKSVTRAATSFISRWTTPSRSLASFTTTPNADSQKNS